MRPALIVAALSALFTATGCASTTLIQSEPTGARLYIDGHYVGKTPYEMTNTKVANAGTAVHLEAPGYEPLDAVVARDGDFAVAPMLGSFLIVPLLWAKDYPARSDFQMSQGGYLAYYVDKLVTPGEPTRALAPSTEPPQVVFGEDVARDAATMRAKGFVEIGEATFNGDDMTKAANEELARGTAVEKRASVVFLYSKEVGGQAPLALANQRVTTTTRTDGSGGVVARSRETDDYTAAAQATAARRFDYTATFWARPAR